MKSKDEGVKPVEVNRGLPSVNETKAKKSYLGLMVFILVVLFIGGGAAYFVWMKVKGATDGFRKDAKPPAEQQQAAKPRVFAPPADGTPGEVDAQGGTPTNPPAPAEAPERPAPLGSSRGVEPSTSSGNIEVPPIEPRRPPSLNGSGAGTDGAGAGAYAGGGAAGERTQDRNRYDTPFVVNGGVQPGGKRAALSPADEALRIGNEALAAASGQGGVASMFGGAPRGEAGKGAMTGMLTPTSTPMVRAGMLGNLSLMVRKGTPVECVLQVKIVAMLPGPVKCRLTSPLYSANGKVVLADRGSEAIGEQSGTLRQGQTRLYVLWTELMTPQGVTIPIDSPGADALGAAGLDGEVDNHWAKRIGASLLLSVIDDAFAYQTAKANAGNGNSGAQGFGLQGTQEQGNRIAEKVLDSTINIPPTLYKHQGEKVSIMVMRHLDFSTVYSLEAK